MSYLVETSYLSCSGVISASRSFDKLDEALAFAFRCVQSLGYDEVLVSDAGSLILNYRRPLKSYQYE